MKYHNDGTKPSGREVFVFGSNLAGVHGAGAAKEAMVSFGAMYGLGFGHIGQSYAIPTKDYSINSLPLSSIEQYVGMFVEYANICQNLEFFVTRVGCGLAGYKDSDIAPMFAGCRSNCSFPIEWAPYLDH